MERDTELIDRINKGDVDAFETLYRRYRDWAWRLAWRFTGRQDMASDVLQETFFYLLKKVPHLRLSAKMTTFLYPVIRHLSRDVRSKFGCAGSPEELFSELPAPASDPAGSGHEDLAAALSILPVPQREVLLMRFVDDMTLDEVALSLQIPLGTVKSRIHNALQALRQDERTRDYFLQ